MSNQYKREVVDYCCLRRTDCKPVYGVPGRSARAGEITLAAFHEEIRAFTAVGITHVIYDPFKDKYKKRPPEVEYLPNFLDNPVGN